VNAEAAFDYSTLEHGKDFVVPKDQYSEEAKTAWEIMSTAVDAKTNYDQVPKYSVTVRHDIAKDKFMNSKYESINWVKYHVNVSQAKQIDHVD
jgi:hypothetical protein